METTAPDEGIAFAILRTAVTLTKQHQLKVAAHLRERLERLYPNNKAEINLALEWWVDYAKKPGVSKRNQDAT